MNLTESQEDYLEAIYIVSKKKPNVRIKHLSEFLDVKNPSVLKAINILKTKDLVKHQKYGYVFLTKKGEETAKKIYKKHKDIAKFFKKILKISDDIADKDACVLEHSLHKITYERMTQFLEFIESCPKKIEGQEPFHKFKFYIEHGERPKEN